MVKNVASENMQKAKIVIMDALKEDEDGNAEQAIELYLQAAEICIKSVGCALLLWTKMTDYFIYFIGFSLASNCHL